MNEKVIGNTNPYLHFIKLIALDVGIIWTLGFCIIFSSWILFGERAAAYLSPNTFALISVTLIWIFATLPFLIRFKKIKRKEVINNVKLKNYKSILLINTLLFIVLLATIIMTPL